MMQSPELGKLAQALAKAQGAIGDALKDKTNPHFKSSYADLASVRAAIQKPMSENGLAYIQLLSTSEDGLDVKTMLIHGESGEFIGDSLTIPLGQRTAQAVGSAASYGRRYGLMAIVGIAADDDDGNAAQQAAPRNGTARKSSAQAKRDDDWPKLEHALSDCGSAVAVDKLQRSYQENEYTRWSQTWREQADEAFDKRRQDFGMEPSEALTLREQLEGSLDEIQKLVEPATRAEYIQACHNALALLPDEETVNTWWEQQAAARKRFRLSPAEETALKARAKARIGAIRAAASQTTFVPNAREKPYVDKAGNPLTNLDAG